MVGLVFGSFASDKNPIIYSDVNVIQNALPCCVLLYNLVLDILI